jgi:hypothetical protein
VIPLFFKDGSESDFKLGASSHTPRPDDQEPPVVEIDSFPNSEAVIAIGFQDVVESVNLTGPTEVHVFFEGLKEGDAQDDDNDGLDEVPTEMVSMELRGNSELLGPIILRAGSGMGMRESPGEIEESFNEITGNLDVAPFLNGGTADSFFDIWFEIEVERQGEVFHNEDAARMEGLITHKPPAPGDQYSKPENVVVELYNDSGEPTGITIVRAIHTPNPRQDLPDLTVSLINPPTIVSCAAGQGSCLHTFEFEVFNNSNVDIPDDIEVLASTSELTVAGSIVTIAGGLGAGASSIQSVTLGPGNNCYNPNCTVIAQVDPSNLILESNEANNSDSRTDVG